MVFPSLKNLILFALALAVRRSMGPYTKIPVIYETAFGLEFMGLLRRLKKIKNIS